MITTLPRGILGILIRRSKKTECPVSSSLWGMPLNTQLVIARVEVIIASSSLRGLGVSLMF